MRTATDYPRVVVHASWRGRRVSWSRATHPHRLQHTPDCRLATRRVPFTDPVGAWPLHTDMTGERATGLTIAQCFRLRLWQRMVRQPSRSVARLLSAAPISRTAPWARGGSAGSCSCRRLTCRAGTAPGAACAAAAIEAYEARMPEELNGRQALETEVPQGRTLSRHQLPARSAISYRPCQLRC